jgi:hypothetical protein
MITWHYNFTKTVQSFPLIGAYTYIKIQALVGGPKNIEGVQDDIS